MSSSKKYLNQHTIVASILIVLVILTSYSLRDTQVDKIKRAGIINVVTRNAPTTYYELHDEKTGFEYDLVTAFADYLGVKANFTVLETTPQILDSITNQQADIAASGLTVTSDRKNKFRFGPSYQSVQQQLVCRRGGPNPKTVTELIASISTFKLTVPAATSYDERLQALSKQNPDIQWQAIQGEDTESLLEQVWLRKLDCTIADSNIIDFNQRYYPELRVRLDLTEPEPLAWLLNKKSDTLQSEIESWFSEYKDSGKLSELLHRYYGFIDKFDYVDNRRFYKRIKTHLPKYKTTMQRAAKKYELDWTLLAAQAYQESHWKANAKSPTGVRGIMMLTQTTAKELGIKNRMDPAMSIWGGARYFRKLQKRLPDSITKSDRTWFALAAYNVGMGHVYDARELATRLDKNPDSWNDVSEVLPLLTKKKYYKTVKHGYARGREPVNYVLRIRNYHDILKNKLNLSK